MEWVYLAAVAETALWYSLPMTDKDASHVTGTHNAGYSPAL